MEGEFSEVKRRTNTKVNEDKMKNQPTNLRGAADGQDDSSTKENIVCKNSKPAVNVNKAAAAATNNNQTSGCKAQVKPKVFGKDFLEAPIPKINPWTKAKPSASSELENGMGSHMVTDVACTKNTNAAETSMVDGSPKTRCKDQFDSVPTPCDTEHEGKTDASPTKNRSYQRSSLPADRTMPAHSSHQAHNPAYRTSKPKQWDKRNKETKQPNTDFTDSAQWPSLDILADKNKQEQQIARPKSQPKQEESNESDADSQAKPGTPPLDDSQESVNNQQTMKKKNKQKWVQLPIEMKTERRRGGGGSRGRGSSRPQNFDDQNRRNRPNFRRPNRIRDSSRQGEGDIKTSDENDRINLQAIPNRGLGFRGRRGQGRGRGGYSRAQRDSTGQDHDEVGQPFFVPTYEGEVESPQVLTEMQQHMPEEGPAASPATDNFQDVKIVMQIEYYFSERNLAKDEYLRRRMDEEGWVDMSLICAFPRVKQLSDNMDEVARAMQKSTLVELSEDLQKLRTKVNPQKWPMKAGEKSEPRNAKWQAIASISKLKVDAPVFVPGQQYIPMNCAVSSKLPAVLKEEQTSQQNHLDDDHQETKDQ